jgi:hypothetical protein
LRDSAETQTCSELYCVHMGPQVLWGLLGWHESVSPPVCLVLLWLEIFWGFHDAVLFRCCRWDWNSEAMRDEADPGV